MVGLGKSSVVLRCLRIWSLWDRVCDGVGGGNELGLERLYM
jgi:hypothetical protein